ncbi:phytanoyl-CoA dioxygenase family protein [Paenibacillus qinlingensis]|uniref:Ectoine hydroxylase-related dioxygenase (Phytanoyl-CoA dioxygenase family) n=1 Tax=Paenibacillus qinlingensis TaxID=1837343 RepID=A0ABU1NUK1_9BACL|nr:phytanoyl-CoA dioxygenase family protein [Paenibacillus qinlingensis]MDR6551155.1 ectoine hydroxylase-related dioxygenase (phytanoyl-CoA dioxygenase family) [Paenibacillus qinlingensis]
MSQQEIQIPEADALLQEEITSEQAQFFLDNGFLVIRNVVVGEELRRLQEQTMEAVEIGMAGSGDEDYFYRVRKNGERKYWRTEYIIDKQEANKVLLAHPFILRSVAKIQGINFIPTWDSLVVKIPNQAASVPWHRDALVPVGCSDPRPIFNVDFYMDEADLKSCLWVIPGSNHWAAEVAEERIGRPGFDVSDAVPVPMNPGDVIFHNIQLLHGSPEGDGNALRRTVYYEFRPGEIEAEFGPHTLEYLSLKQHMLVDCIEKRKAASYTLGETPYDYQPTGAFAIGKKQAPKTYRYAHSDYWRA